MIYLLYAYDPYSCEGGWDIYSHHESLADLEDAAMELIAQNKLGHHITIQLFTAEKDMSAAFQYYPIDSATRSKQLARFEKIYESGEWDVWRAGKKGTTKVPTTEFKTLYR